MTKMTELGNKDTKTVTIIVFIYSRSNRKYQNMLSRYTEDIFLRCKLNF